jgi:2-deoxy-D-gluconate 3-dehydrogenase
MKRRRSWRGTCCDYWQKDDTGLAVDLAGKTALVTGASSGIGRATALALAAAGARVALTRRSEARLGEVAGIIGAKEVVLPADLAVAGACAAVVTQAQAALGRIDILIANAGL